MATRPKLSVLHALAPAPYGGLESVVRGLTTGLARRGHRVGIGVLAARDAEGLTEFVDSVRRSELEVFEWRAAGHGYLSQGRQVVETCRRWEPDLVHTHGYHADVVAGLAARWVRAPVTTTVHGFVGGGWKNRFYERLQRWAFRWFDAVVPVSRQLGRELAGAGVPSGRIHPIPNAWSEHVAPVDRARARDALGLTGSGSVVGWVGRVSREKGLDVLIEALSGLEGVPWHLAVVGHGPDLAAQRDRVADLGLGDRVTWHGVVADAGRYFRAFDAFCLSSRTEGMPVVLFEAMAAGVPVVATRVGGVGEVLDQESAWLCPPEDPEALRAGLRAALLNADAAREKAATARTRLEEVYGVESWLDRYEALYGAVSGVGGGGEDRAPAIDASESAS